MMMMTCAGGAGDQRDFYDDNNDINDGQVLINDDDLCRWSG